MPAFVLSVVDVAAVLDLTEGSTAASASRSRPAISSSPRSSATVTIDSRVRIGLVLRVRAPCGRAATGRRRMCPSRTARCKRRHVVVVAVDERRAGGNQLFEPIETPVTRGHEHVPHRGRHAQDAVLKADRERRAHLDRHVAISGYPGRQRCRRSAHGWPDGGRIARLERFHELRPVIEARLTRDEQLRVRNGEVAAGLFSIGDCVQPLPHPGAQFFPCQGGAPAYSWTRCIAAAWPVS